jgi:hypothetical protein
LGCEVVKNVTIALNTVMIAPDFIEESCPDPLAVSPQLVALAVVQLHRGYHETFPQEESSPYASHSAELKPA